jgi:transglutaminase-like putative cysteine protease
MMEVRVTPDAEMASHLDYYGNAVWMIAVESPHRELVIECHSEVEVQPPHIDPVLDHHWDVNRLAFHPSAEFLAPSPRVPRLRAVDELVEAMGVRSDDTGSIVAANRSMREQFSYMPGATTVVTHLSEVLDRRVGVCQDFAHVLLAVARQAGWPARYVSGYLLPSREEAVGESHAWVELATPDGRWIGLDPTHGVAVTDGHVRVAVGRDYGDVAPVRGTFAGQLPGEPPEVRVRIRELAVAGAGLPAHAIADQ